MKYVVKFLSFLMLLFLFGCASLPTPQEMRDDIVDFRLPKLPEEGKAIVYVVRPASIGALIRFKVFVDDKEPDSEKGYTRGMQYIYFDLELGDHQILSQAENTSAVNVTAEDGDIIYIQQDAQMGVLFARNSVMTVPDYQGKYYVKRLKLGTMSVVDQQSNLAGDDNSD